MSVIYVFDSFWKSVALELSGVTFLIAVTSLPQVAVLDQNLFTQKICLGGMRWKQLLLKSVWVGTCCSKNV